MFDMANATLDIHTARLAAIRQELEPIEKEAKEIHGNQVANHIKIIALTEEAWGHKLQQLFPGVPVVDRHCISEITPQDPLNKAVELPAMLQKLGFTITQIEYDQLRNTYRLYGRKDTPELAKSVPPGQAPGNQS